MLVAESAGALRRKAMRVLLRWQRVGLLGAWDSWCQAIEGRRAAQELLAREERERVLEARERERCKLGVVDDPERPADEHDAVEPLGGL